ncbi:hedgehog interacting protein-like protein [Penaeus vannamei]|uniref:Hedgehog interacting protein-like protein n=1 Tax=Penaeus vannamei TaxID=6689 RepID=A0A423SA74_PENVA|nr:hedgehog interacting protein-like protein [Penaeus vannamei]
MEEVVKVELIENETSARQSGCNFEVLSSIEELNSYIKAQEEATLSKFIVYNKDKTFGNDHYRPGPGQPIGHISWLGDNVPHIRIGRKRYGCHQGRDKQVKAKERYKEQKRKAEEEGQAVTKKRRLYQDSKKLSCPFQFTAIQILKFPEFEVEHGSSPYLKQKTAAVIKSAIKEGEPIEMVMEYHVIIPPKEEHRNHPIEGPIAHLRERVAEEVIDKITELARQGVKKVSEMKPHLERYVENDLGVRDETKTRRRFYPTNKDFQNIMQRAKKRPNQSVVDKESLQELIERWQAESPAQHEASTAIQEALEIIKEWNPNWRPGCFLADFNNEDIMALETVFPDTCVLLSDFHREKAWSEWLCSEGNEVSHIGVAIKNMLNRIAQASTVSLYHEALNTFQSSAIWRDSQEIKDWFSNTWLPNVQRWATAFRSSTHTLLIRMNNGIERQNELLKSSFLDGYKNCSLSNLMTVIVTDFLPKSYKRYVELNRRRSFKYTNSDGELPTFLHELPLDVAQHVMKRWYGNLSSESIHQGSNKSMFLVASEMGSSLHYEVHLGNDVMPPSYVNALHDDEYLEELNEELDDMVRTIRAGVQIITDQ